MEKPQNFYAHLDNFSICSENILSYCEEFVEMESDLIDYFKKEEKTKRNLKSKMIILGAETKAELAAKKLKEIAERRKVVSNVSKFISFMKKEEKKYNKIMKSKAYIDYLDNETDLDIEFFEQIEFIPVYVVKHSGVLVRDLTESFKSIKDLLATDIEDILGVPFPLKGSSPQLMLVQHTIKKNNINLTREQINELTHFILTYDDFDYLIEIIKSEIKELEEPLRR